MSVDFLTGWMVAYMARDIRSGYSGPLAGIRQCPRGHTQRSIIFLTLHPSNNQIPFVKSHNVIYRLVL